METGFIYSLNCPITGELKYIGQTKTRLRNRFNAHNKDPHLTKKSEWVRLLQENNLKPTTELIDTAPVNEINFWEKHYISLYRSWGFELTNMRYGGASTFRHTEATKAAIGLKNKGRKISEEARKKMRESHLKNPQRHWLGKKLSKEHVKKMSESKKGTPAWNKGISPSKETRIKIGLAFKGKPSHMKGKHHSDESKLKMSLAKKGRPSGRINFHHSQETKDRLSLISKSRVYPKGRPVSDETRKKMSLAKIGKPTWNKGKKKGDKNGQI